MNKVNYAVKVGDFNDEDYLVIDMRIAGGLSKDDYGTLRSAFQAIEDIAYHYKEIRGTNAEKAGSDNAS